MTDYSDAGAAKTEIPENFKFDVIPAKNHKPIIEWRYAEFQSLCPMSQRHDQGILRLIYKPNNYLLESKSMREYLREWRNLQNWQEYIAEEISDAVFKAIEPIGLVVDIEWTARGGIYARTVSKRGEDINL